MYKIQLTEQDFDEWIINDTKMCLDCGHFNDIHETICTNCFSGYVVDPMEALVLESIEIIDQYDELKTQELDFEYDNYRKLG
jgi:predicted metal-dependent TIM-barrel fold hydrolase